MILSGIVFLLTILFFWFVSSTTFGGGCDPQLTANCTDLKYFSPIDKQTCGCLTVWELLKHWGTIITPGLIVYIVYSIFEIFFEKHD